MVVFFVFCESTDVKKKKNKKNKTKSYFTLDYSNNEKGLTIFCFTIWYPLLKIKGYCTSFAVFTFLYYMSP